MSLTKHKRISVLGMEFTAAVEAQRAEQMTRSLWWRYLMRPSLQLLDRNGKESHPAPPANVILPPAGLNEKIADPEGVKLWEQISKLPWYHTMDLGHGVITPGFEDHRAYTHLYGLPTDLRGKRCLDIGTFDGFWAFEMERRGADEVIALDVESPADYDVPRGYRKQWMETVDALRPEPIQVCYQIAHKALKSKVRREILNVYELSPEKLGMFDVVFISNVLVHLRDPQTVLENMFSVTREAAIVAENFSPELDKFDNALSEFHGDPYPFPYFWWRHSVKSLSKIIQVAGFHPVEEVSRLLAETRQGPFWKVVLKGHVPQ